MNLLIIGRGISGEAAALLAAALGYRAVMAADGEGAAPDWQAVDLVVASPGVGPASPLLRQALAAGVEVVSELEFGSRHYPAPMLGVTGTNGKTTTTELTAHLLRRLQSRPVVEAGNIGNPLSRVAAQCLSGGGEWPLAVVEVSSFQLEYVSTFAPLAAAILNVASDHLDRYGGSIAGYQAVKYRIFDRVAPANRIALHGLPGGAAPVWRCDAGGVFYRRGVRRFDQSATQLPGEHNAENLLAALELAERVLDAGVMASPELPEAVAEYRPGRHRLEQVAAFGEDIVCIDDSKATNPASVVAALRALRRPVRILLGGLDKGMDFSPIGEAAASIRHAYLIGRAAGKIAAALDGLAPWSRFATLEEAVAAMVGDARPGEAVLLSPGCASMDMFKDYRERGERFAAACRAAVAAVEKGGQIPCAE